MNISWASRKTITRKPSHFGSKIQSPSTGRLSTRLASIGRTVGLTARFISPRHQRSPACIRLVTSCDPLHLPRFELHFQPSSFMPIEVVIPIDGGADRHTLGEKLLGMNRAGAH